MPHTPSVLASSAHGWPTVPAAANEVPPMRWTCMHKRTHPPHAMAPPQPLVLSPHRTARHMPRGTQAVGTQAVGTRLSRCGPHAAPVAVRASCAASRKPPGPWLSTTPGPPHAALGQPEAAGCRRRRLLRLGAVAAPLGAGVRRHDRGQPRAPRLRRAARHGHADADLERARPRPHLGRGVGQGRQARDRRRLRLGVPLAGTPPAPLDPAAPAPAACIPRSFALYLSLSPALVVPSVLREHAAGNASCHLALALMSLRLRPASMWGHCTAVLRFRSVPLRDPRLCVARTHAAPPSLRQPIVTTALFRCHRITLRCRTMSQSVTLWCLAVKARSQAQARGECIPQAWSVRACTGVPGV